MHAQGIHCEYIHLPYCPKQAPMDACSSSTKIWEWVVTRRKWLNGSTNPEQEPTLDAKLATMGPNRLVLSVRPCFVKASPTVEKAVAIVLQSGQSCSLNAKFPQR